MVNNLRELRIYYIDINVEIIYNTDICYFSFKDYFYEFYRCTISLRRLDISSSRLTVPSRGRETRFLDRLIFM